jgi:uncharacterized NAD(P)/FAD-binding protein YdhS
VELKRDEGEKIKLNMAFKPPAKQPVKTGLGMKLAKPAAKPKSLSAMLKESVKEKKAASTSPKSNSDSLTDKKPSAVEEIMRQEKERKRRFENAKAFGDKRRREDKYR